MDMKGCPLRRCSDDASFPRGEIDLRRLRASLSPAIDSLSHPAKKYAMFIPELDLVIATYGGSHADRGGFVTLRQLIPEHILPAIVR